MYFGSVRLGKAYVSFHLMPLYMCPVLAKSIPPAGTGADHRADAADRGGIQAVARKKVDVNRHQSTARTPKDEAKGDEEDVSLKVWNRST
jgi:hypothetical protein